MSAMSVIDASGTLVAAILLITAAGFLAVWSGQSWTFILGIGLALCQYFWQQHNRPLAIVSEEEYKIASRSTTAVFLATLFPFWFT